jgi:hypothetical protein
MQQIFEKEQKSKVAYCDKRIEKKRVEFRVG